MGILGEISRMKRERKRYKKKGDERQNYLLGFYLLFLPPSGLNLPLLLAFILETLNKVTSRPILKKEKHHKGGFSRRNTCKIHMKRILRKKKSRRAKSLSSKPKY